MQEEQFSEFRKKLDDQHDWPSLYMFKFIVPSGKEDQIKKLFPKNDVVLKSSGKGNYYSVTVQMMLNSSDEVIKIYEEVNQIDGVISL